jgi:hypothetical protein
MERLRSLSEDECYLRCYGSAGYRSAGYGSASYGWRGSGDSVRLVPSTTRPKLDLRREQSQAGERLRRLLGLRIDARDSFEAA